MATRESQETQAPMDFSNLSDRERHNLMLQKKAQEKKAQAEQMEIEPKPIVRSSPAGPTRSTHVEPFIQAVAKREWACSNCEGCREFVKGPRPGKCKSCTCDLLFHLKEEEEYGDHCIGK